MAHTNSIRPLVIKRLYKHQRDRVFKAFSSGEALQKWIAPAASIATRVLVHEFRVGSCYRIAFSLPEGADIVLGGEYVHIEQPGQICFTWCWEEPDIHAGIDSLVTVNLVAIGEHTEMTITHENLSTTQASERHDQGWSGALARLEDLLTLTI